MEGVSKIAARLVVPSGLALILYQLVSVWYTLHGSMQHYVTHLAGILIVATLIALAETSSNSGQRRILLLLRMLAAIIAMAAVIAISIYMYFNIETFEIMQPFVGDEALFVGVSLVITVLVITWLLWGFPLAFMCTLAALYFAWGHLLPGPLAAPHTEMNVVISFLAGLGGPRGVFAYIPLSADLIFLLLIYGGFMHGCRIIEMFVELGRSIGNLLRGGVAYSAVFASSLIGMVTGQAIANIALSGSMTIPTMRRNGFTREQAGAIEILASINSQLLPPIMGLGAFLMAEILGVAYFDIVVAAFIPALLFMAAIILGVFAMITASHNITYDVVEVDWAKIRSILPSFAVSFAALLGVLYLRYSPAMAGFWGVALLLALAWLRPARYQPTFESIRVGAYQGISIAVYLALMLAAIGVLIQMLQTTGTGLELGRAISTLAGESLPATLLIGMVIALLIGMGLPTPAAYALIAIVVTPALVDVGLEPLTAHMYGFYFAILSTLTPPVAVGILTAMRISGGTFLATAKECFALASACFLVPFLFVAMPEILAPQELGLTGCVGIALALIATAMLLAGIYGAFGYRLQAYERIGAVLLGPISFILFLWNAVAWWLGLIGPITFVLWLVIRSSLARATMAASYDVAVELEQATHRDRRESTTPT